MYPRGTIYQRGESKRHGSIVLQAPLPTRILYGFLRGAGAGVIGFAIITLFVYFMPVIQEELNYSINGQKQYQDYMQSQILVDRAEAQKQQVREEAAGLGVESYFSVVIPKIGAKANIIPNVDTADEKAYLAALQKGVGHARSTYFPSQGKRIYLFAHSTDGSWNVARYNAVFYLLRKLEKGDRIVVFFADKKFEYEVVEKVMAHPKDVSWITKAGEVSQEELVLQTCDPPGTTWHRLLVIARPVR